MIASRFMQNQVQRLVPGPASWMSPAIQAWAAVSLDAGSNVLSATDVEENDD
jgi:hypothetical protein